MAKYSVSTCGKPDMTISSEVLIKLRKDRGWSQERLAAISGVSERTIQRIERNGECSLETKMAIASAFEISPSDLTGPTLSQNGENIELKISWGGVAGLFVLGLTAPLIAILTAVDGRWELISFLIVIGFTAMLSLVNYGARATYRLFDNSSWLVRYPSKVRSLNSLIAHAKSIIEYAYIVGIVSTIVTALTIATHSPSKMEPVSGFIMLVVRPLFYSILFVELWFRPYKKKMESMLVQQNTAQE